MNFKMRDVKNIREDEHGNTLYKFIHLVRKHLPNACCVPALCWALGNCAELIRSFPVPNQLSPISWEAASCLEIFPGTFVLILPREPSNL